MTTGQRLAKLAKATGSAKSLLLLIGVGATTGAALVAYSKLATGTAMQHLLVDHPSSRSRVGSVDLFIVAAHSASVRLGRDEPATVGATTDTVISARADCLASLGATSPISLAAEPTPMLGAAALARLGRNPDARVAALSQAALGGQIPTIDLGGFNTL